MKKDLRDQGIKEAGKVEEKPYMTPFNELKREVYNPQGEHLGKIEDVILDLNNQRIAFGILSFGGVWGIGNLHYAIPWQMLKYEQKDGQFILDIDKEKLEGAEGYDPVTYPYTNYGPWAGGVYGYWGYPPYWV